MSWEVTVTVDEVLVEGARGRQIKGICITCDECGHAVEVWGRGDTSVRRGCAQLRDECPAGEQNYYTSEEY